MANLAAAATIIEGPRLNKTGALSKAIKNRLVIKALGKPLEEVLKREGKWNGKDPMFTLVMECMADRQGIQSSSYRGVGHLRMVGMRMSYIYPDIPSLKDISVKLLFDLSKLDFSSSGVLRNLSKWEDSSEVASFCDSESKEIAAEDMPGDFPGFSTRIAVVPYSEDSVCCYVQLYPESLENLSAELARRGLVATSFRVPSLFVRSGKEAARQVPLGPLEKVRLIE